MQVEVRSNTGGTDKAEWFSSIAEDVKNGLQRYGNRLTRVEVHLSDENGPKSGNDCRCAMEARPVGRPPLAVTHHASNFDEAVQGAIEKLDRLLASTFGKHDEKGGTSASGLPT
jgi:hypothetical protein